MQSKSHSSTTPRNAVDFSGPELIWDGLMPSGKVFCGLTSRHFKLFLENVDVVSSGPKRKRTIRTVMDAKFKSQHLWWYGAVLVPVAWGTCTSVKAPLMLKGTYRFWSNTCCHPSNVFFMDAPAYFSKTMPNHISARLTTAWLRSKRVRVLDWPACSPDLSPIENVWRIMKRKIRQRRPRTVEQLKLYIKQEWERIPPTKLQQLVSSVPKRLLSVVKRKGDVTQW